MEYKMLWWYWQMLFLEVLLLSDGPLLEEWGEVGTAQLVQASHVASPATVGSGVWGCPWVCAELGAKQVNARLCE